MALREFERFDSAAQAKKNVVQAIEVGSGAVGEHAGSLPQVLHSSERAGIVYGWDAGADAKATSRKRTAGHIESVAAGGRSRAGIIAAAFGDGGDAAGKGAFRFAEGQSKIQTQFFGGIATSSVGKFSQVHVCGGGEGVFFHFVFGVDVNHMVPAYFQVVRDERTMTAPP